METPVVRVRKANLAVFDSFCDGIGSQLLQIRTRKAKQGWQVTDEMTVRSYSYSLNALRIVFDTATLDIVGNRAAVEWELQHFALPPLVYCTNPCCLVHVDFDEKRELFDRDQVLSQIVGLRIRYSPSHNGLYLIWKPNHEISLNCLPLEEREEYLLHYTGPTIMYPSPD
jgi:hypothetical protein